MCRECSARWCEDRCPKCRPRYGPAELTERRLNRVKRREWLRCDVCDLEGPRLDLVKPVGWRGVLLIPLAGIATVGVASLVLALLSLNETMPVCPGCDRSDELEPSLHTDLPKPPGWDEISAVQARVRRRNAIVVGGALLLALGLGFGLFFLSVTQPFDE
jgi:hypothetical protein